MQSQLKVSVVNKLGDVATYFLTVSDFFCCSAVAVLSLLLYHYTWSLPFLSSSDRTTCKGRSHIKSLDKYIFSHCLLRVSPLKSNSIKKIQILLSSRCFLMKIDRFLQ